MAGATCRCLVQLARDCLQQENHSVCSMRRRLVGKKTNSAKMLSADVGEKAHKATRKALAIRGEAAIILASRQASNSNPRPSGLIRHLEAKKVHFSTMGERSLIA